MSIPFEASVIRRPDRQLDFPQLLYAWLRIGLHGPIRLRLNHFMRKIIEGFKNCFSFHNWRFGCCAGVLSEFNQHANGNQISIECARLGIDNPCQIVTACIKLIGQIGAEMRIERVI